MELVPGLCWEHRPRVLFLGSGLSLLEPPLAIPHWLAPGSRSTDLLKKLICTNRRALLKTIPHLFSPRIMQSSRCYPSCSAELEGRCFWSHANEHALPRLSSEWSWKRKPKYSTNLCHPESLVMLDALVNKLRKARKCLHRLSFNTCSRWWQIEASMSVSHTKEQYPTWACFSYLNFYDWNGLIKCQSSFELSVASRPGVINRTWQCCKFLERPQMPCFTWCLVCRPAAAAPGAC